jgi:hypothetical protein
MLLSSPTLSSNYNRRQPDDTMPWPLSQVSGEPICSRKPFHSETVQGYSHMCVSWSTTLHKPVTRSRTFSEPKAGLSILRSPKSLQTLSLFQIFHTIHPVILRLCNQVTFVTRDASSALTSPTLNLQNRSLRKHLGRTALKPTVHS